MRGNDPSFDRLCPLIILDPIQFEKTRRTQGVSWLLPAKPLPAPTRGGRTTEQNLARRAHDNRQPSCLARASKYPSRRTQKARLLQQQQQQQRRASGGTAGPQSVSVILLALLVTLVEAERSEHPVREHARVGHQQALPLERGRGLGLGKENAHRNTTQQG